MKQTRITLKEAAEILAAYGNDGDRHNLGHPFVIPSSTIDNLRARVLKGRTWEEVKASLQEEDSK